MSSIKSIKTLLPKVDFTIISLFDILYSKTQAITHKGVDFFYSIDSKLRNMFHGEKEYLIQIMFPLLVNAFNNTEEGYILVTAKQLAQSGNKHRILFMVQDTGPGLLYSTINEFNSETFKSEDNFYTKNGLAIAKELCHQINGDIWVDSKKGYGTTFYMTIELEETQVHDLGKSALIISKSDLSSLFFDELLTTQNVEVSISNNINYLNDNFSKYDILILDLQADELNLINYIIDDIHQKQIPIIVVTPPLSREKRHIIKSSRIQNHIEKPISIPDFLKTINILRFQNRIQSFKIDPLLKKYADNKDLLIQMAELFMSEIPGKLIHLNQEIINKNREEAYGLAHSLSNSVGIFKADKVFNMLKDLEFKIRKEEFKAALSLYLEIKNEMEDILFEVSKVIP